MRELAQYLSVAFTASTPILVTAIGGAFAERARATNIAMEGMMLVSAFFALAVTAASGSAWLGLLGGVAAAEVLALILAVAVFTFGCDLFIAGIGLNLLASGLTLLLLGVLYDEPGTYSPLDAPSLPRVDLGPLADVPLLGTALQGQSVLFYLTIALVVLGHVVLRRTRLGVWIRAVGEHEEAATAAGISVVGVRTATLLISGFTAGIGGAFLSISALGVFAADMTSGRGFIALAATIFGGGTVLGTSLAAGLFGLAEAASIRFQQLAIPVELVLMLPYLVTILALTVYGLRRRRSVRWATADIGYLPPVLPRD